MVIFMKNFKVLLLLLCFCLILPIAACGKTETPSADTDGKYKYDGLTRETAQDTIPDGYDMDNQTITIWMHGQKDDSIGIADSTDIVYSRIHERNLRVEERLNVDIDFYYSSAATWQDSSDEVKREIQTMSAAFEAVFCANNRLVGKKLFNYFHDLNDSNYIDLSEEWWYEDTIMELSIDRYNYRFLYGDIHLSNITRAGAIYYNKALYEQYVSTNKNPDELYQTVLDGKWTLEEFARLVKNGRIERGGDGSTDIWGLSIDYAEWLHYFTTAAGINYYERNEYGMPVFNFKNYRSVTFINQIYSLYYENTGVTNSLYGGSTITPVFENGEVLFEISNLLQSMEAPMREMKDDFGILPYPKLDVEQEEYITLLHSSACTAAIPVCTDIERANEEISAVIEALCSESYRSVSITFYETALKAAYNRDDQSSQMIDIITGQHDTVKSIFKKDFVHDYSGSLGSLGGIFTSLMREKSTNFISKYDSMIGTAESGLKDLIQQYKDGKI